MLKNQAINLKIIEKVASALGEINHEVIYVGGAIICMYVTDDGAEQPRPTKDIDISVQISTYTQMNKLQDKLASKGFYPANMETVLYRYIYEDILVDFIPYAETPLGPTNRWFRPGFEKAYSVDIENIKIRILPVSMFLATKWEAYNKRGGDPRTSHDFEDIIYVIDNNRALVEDINKAEKEVQNFLIKMSISILHHPSLNEIIECHISPYTALERRLLIIDKLKKIASIG